MFDAELLKGGVHTWHVTAGVRYLKVDSPAGAQQAVKLIHRAIEIANVLHHAYQDEEVKRFLWLGST